MQFLNYTVLIRLLMEEIDARVATCSDSRLTDVQKRQTKQEKVQLFKWTSAQEKQIQYEVNKRLP